MSKKNAVRLLFMVSLLAAVSIGATLAYAENYFVWYKMSLNIGDVISILYSN